MKKRILLVICLLIIFLAAVIIGLCIKYVFVAPPVSIDVTPPMVTPIVTDTPVVTEDPRVDGIIERRIDFADWQATNNEIYAWIFIPGTRVNYPIVQSRTSNQYYLNRDIHGNNSIAGAIFTENRNTMSFTDRNTLIYGHNMRNGTMFADTLQYTNRDYFDAHREIYIFTPDRAYRYVVFAAYVTDDNHILVANDFSSEEGFQIYLDKLAAFTVGAFDREREITTDDRIITLSTCTPRGDERFLTQAVLEEIYIYEE